MLADRKHYPSDLTDTQWRQVEPLVRGNPVGPQPVVHSRREVVNAILIRVAHRRAVAARSTPSKS
jgi:transposase